jgi:integrase
MNDGGGLLLNIAPGGSKSWVFRYTYPKGGKVREIGVGGYPGLKLAQARQVAEQYRQLVSEGKDPKAERDREAGRTFGEAADEYFNAMKDRWTNAKSRYQWRRSLEETCKPIRDTQVANIGTEDVLSVLQAVWVKTPETGSRMRGRIESVLDYAKTKGWCTGENPARWRGHLENILPKRDKKRTVVHLPSMPYADVSRFMADLRERPAIAARALEFLILTATRTSEVLGARWTEIDFKKAVWTIPAERMKLRRLHEVPLSPRAIEILMDLKVLHCSEYCFPGQKAGRPLSNMVLQMLLRRMKVQGVTPHGFRSSFRDWCGDETSFPREIAEAALAHQVGSDVERAYRRGTALEKRRQLLDAWARYCAGDDSAKVVALHG